jgi:hypothetical protein
MEEITKKLVELYQCPGCVCGSDIDCYQPSSTGIGCGKHIVGTIIRSSLYKKSKTNTY